MNELQRDKESKRIISVYEKSVPHLELFNIGHFFERAYGLTQDPKHADLTAYHVYINKAIQLRYAEKVLRTRQFPKFTGLKNPKQRGKRRKKLYLKNPRLAFIDLLVFDLLFMDNFSVTKTVFKKEYQSVKKLLQKENLKALYLQEEVIRNDNSQAVTAAVLLRRLGITNFAKQLDALVKKVYFDKNMQPREDLDEWDMRSLFYVLTHLVIADSRFYVRYVTEYIWVLDYFANSYETIMKYTTLDIQSEIALCFRLAKKEQKYKAFYDKLLTHIEKSWNPECINTPEGAAKYEHTASIIMLVFAKNGPVGRAPNISKHPIFNILKKC